MLKRFLVLAVFGCLMSTYAGPPQSLGGAEAPPPPYQSQQQENSDGLAYGTLGYPQPRARDVQPFYAPVVAYPPQQHAQPKPQPIIQIHGHCNWVFFGDDSGDSRGCVCPVNVDIKPIVTAALNLFTCGKTQAREDDEKQAETGPSTPTTSAPLASKHPTLLTKLAALVRGTPTIKTRTLVQFSAPKTTPEKKDQ